MSSYLNIWLKVKPKETDQKDDKQAYDKDCYLLFSYSRNSEIYDYFNENGVSYIGIGDGEMNYTVLSEELLNRVEGDISDDIQKSKKSLNMDKEILMNSKLSDEQLNDYRGSVLSMQEYIDEKKEALNIVTVLRDLVRINQYNEKTELICNID